MFKVGITTRSYQDPDRRNWAGSGPRPLETVLWYPARATVEVSDIYLGPEDEADFVMGPAAWGAEPAQEPRRMPLVLLSHGTGGSALQMGWLARRLAAAGYLCVAVNHHGNTASEPYLPQGFLAWWERPRDLSVLADRVLSDATFGARVDSDRILAAGFSLGGYSVASLVGGVTDLARFQRWAEGAGNQGQSKGPREFPDLADHLPRLLAEDEVFRASHGRHGSSYNDPRICAALLLSPALGQAFAEDSLRAIDCPLSIIVGEDDQETPPGPNAAHLAEKIPGASLKVLPGPVGHYVFLCEATALGRQRAAEICCDDPGVHRRTIHDDTAAAAIALFERHFGIDTTSTGERSHVA